MKHIRIVETTVMLACLAVAAPVWATNYTFIDLGTLVEGGGSYANGVNATGQVAGISDTTGGTFHAFLTGANGHGMADLGTPLGAYTSFATGVNDSGQVVGDYFATNGTPRAFLTGANGQGMTDLNSSLNASAVAAGWVLNYAYAINNNGWIVGTATNSYTGTQDAYLLTLPAVPEPRSYAMLLVGLGMIGFLARRRNRHPG